MVIPGRDFFSFFDIIIMSQKTQADERPVWVIVCESFVHK